MAVERVQRCELRRGDRVRDLRAPQQIPHLHSATKKMSWMLHPVFGWMRIRRFFLHPSSPQRDNRQARGADRGAPRWCPIYLAEARAQKVPRSRRVRRARTAAASEPRRVRQGSERRLHRLGWPATELRAENAAGGTEPREK